MPSALSRTRLSKTERGKNAAGVAGVGHWPENQQQKADWSNVQSSQSECHDDVLLVQHVIVLIMTLYTIILATNWRKMRI